MLSLCSPPSADGANAVGGNGDAEENQEHAERGRQEARSHMHERAGPIGRAFERDAEAEQKHQSASVEITLAHELAERAGGRPHYFLPAVFGAVTIFAPIFRRNEQLSSNADDFRSDAVSRVSPVSPRCGKLAPRRPCIRQVSDDIGHRVGVQLTMDVITRLDAAVEVFGQLYHAAKTPMPTGANKSGLSLRTLPTRRSTGQNAMLPPG